jgi:hypothetical protein
VWSIGWWWLVRLIEVCGGWGLQNGGLMDVGWDVRVGFEVLAM